MEVPSAVVGEILAGLAAELEPAVMQFMADPLSDLSPFLANDHDYSSASMKLRLLHDALDRALLNRAPPVKLATLSAAVRLQATVFYNTIKAQKPWLSHQSR